MGRCKCLALSLAPLHRPPRRYRLRDELLNGDLLYALCEAQTLAERQLRVQMLQGDGGPGKALDQGALDGAQPIGATESTFDIGDKAIECLGRASAAVELAARKQLRLGCRAARRAPFAANRALTPRTPWRSPPARAGKDQSAGRAPAACSKLQGDGGRAKWIAQQGVKLQPGAELTRGRGELRVERTRLPDDLVAALAVKNPISDGFELGG